MLKKIIKYAIYLSLLAVSLYCYLNINLTSNKALNLIIVALPELILIIAYLLGFSKFKRLYKICIITYILTCISIIVYSILNKLNILDSFSSVVKLKDYILSTKEEGVILYIIIQLLQVVFLPIPASVICIVGSLIYGPLMGGLYCCLGVLIGSLISFAIGRIFGYKLVSWVVGKENTDKYSEIIRTRGVFFLGLAFLLPMFPDDILCFIAGLTKMKFRQFFWITLITRPIGVICMSVFGSGYIIPFTGWGIYAWVGILLVVISLVIIIFKWQDKIQTHVINKVFKKKI